MRSSLCALCVAIAVVAGLLPASSRSIAQEWPSAKPITLIMPFAAGSDFMARLIAAELEKRIGQRVIVENRPGAAGATGTAYAARQAPDGYTLIMAAPGAAANHLNTFPSLPYNPLTDFDHITQISVANMALMARKDFPANNLDELIVYAKAHPGKVSIGNNGVGSAGHRIGLLLGEKADVLFKFVPYRGSPPIMADMMAGTLDMMSDYYGANNAKAVETGQVKLIAFSSPQRPKLRVTAPTFRESGIDIVSMAWQGIMAPKGTPRPIIDKINAAIRDYLTSEEGRARFETIAQEPAPTTPEEFHKIVVEEEAMWRDIIKKYGIKPE